MSTPQDALTSLIKRLSLNGISGRLDLVSSMLSVDSFSVLNLLPHMVRVPCIAITGESELASRQKYHETMTWIKEQSTQVPRSLSDLNSYLMIMNIVHGRPPFTVVAMRGKEIIEPLTRTIQTWIQIGDEMWFVCINGLYNHNRWQPEHWGLSVRPVFSNHKPQKTKQTGVGHEKQHNDQGS